MKKKKMIRDLVSYGDEESAVNANHSSKPESAVEKEELSEEKAAKLEED